MAAFIFNWIFHIWKTFLWKLLIQKCIKKIKKSDILFIILVFCLYSSSSSSKKKTQHLQLNSSISFNIIWLWNNQVKNSNSKNYNEKFVSISFTHWSWSCVLMGSNSEQKKWSVIEDIKITTTVLSLKTEKLEGKRVLRIFSDSSSCDLCISLPVL